MACLMAAFSLGSALVRRALPSLRGAAGSAERGARCGAGGRRWSGRDASRGKSRGCGVQDGGAEGRGMQDEGRGMKDAG